MSRPDDAFRRRALERHHGFGGTIIVPHRSIRTLDLKASRFVLTLLVSLGLTILWLGSVNYVFDAWAGIEQFMLRLVGIEGQVELQVRHVVWGYALHAPSIQLDYPLVSSSYWWVGLIGAAAVLLLSWAVPPSWLPLRFLMRLLVLVQVSALIYFRGGRQLPYDIGGYTEVMHIAGAMVIGLIPFLYGFTFYPLDFSRGKKIAATLLAMSHLCFFIPMQYLCHAMLLHVGSLLFMPVLFWAFGLMVDVFIVIAIYGWAASWEPLPYRHRSWWIPLRPALPAIVAVVATVLVLSVAARANGQTPPVAHSIRGGMTFGQYDRDLGNLNGQFVRYRGSRYFLDSWSVDVGRASRFEDWGFGLGVGYARHLRRDTVANVGVSTGTGEVIFPDIRLDAGIDHSILPDESLVLSLGYTHIESKFENRSDSWNFGARYYTPASLIFSGFFRVEKGHPGSTTSTAWGGGALFNRPQNYSLSAGFEIGDVSYVLLLPDEAAVDFNSTIFRAGGSKYLDEDWGLSGGFDYSDTDVYNLWTVTLEVFKEW